MDRAISVLKMLEKAGWSTTDEIHPEWQRIASSVDYMAALPATQSDLRYLCLTLVNLFLQVLLGLLNLSIIPA